MHGDTGCHLVERTDLVSTKAAAVAETSIDQ